MSKNFNIIVNFPHDLMQNGIFKFLNLNDVFYSARGVCIDWAILMKEVYNEKMQTALKKYIKFREQTFERECLIKLVEKKINHLNSYKSMLNFYTENHALYYSTLLLLNMLTDEKIKNLVSFFFNFLGLHEARQLIEISIVQLISYMSQYNVIEDKIDSNILIESNFECGYSLDNLHEFKKEFDKLDRSYLEQSCESSKIMYCYLSFVIVYLIMKKESVQESIKIEELSVILNAPCKESWQEKQYFYESSFKLVNYSLFSNEKTKKMMAIFDKENIKNPMQDYKEESLKLTLKKNIEIEELDKDEMKFFLFEYLDEKRLLLSKTLHLMEDFYTVYEKYKVNENYIIIGDEEIDITKLLLCMRKIYISNKVFSVKSLLGTKRYLDTRQINFLESNDILENYSDYIEEENMSNLSEEIEEDI